MVSDNFKSEFDDLKFLFKSGTLLFIVLDAAFIFKLLGGLDVL